MMDSADASRELRGNVERELNIAGEKWSLTGRLVAASAARGLVLSEDDAARAVNAYFDGLYSFKAPQQSASTALAGLYINRSAIGRRYGIPALVFLAIAVPGTMLASFVGQEQLRQRARDAESGLSAACRQIASLYDDLAVLAATRIDAALQQDLDTSVLSGRGSLMQTGDFSERFCSDYASISGMVTEDNYERIGSETGSIKPALASAQAHAAEGRAVVDMNKRSLATRQSLDSLIQEIRSQSPAKPLLDKAETTYASGIAALNNRQQPQAEEYQTQLGTIRAGVQKFSVLPTQLEQLYASVRTVSREDAALQQAESLYRQGQTYVGSVDVSQLEQTVSKMEQLRALLETEFTIKVVNRPGVKSGIDRYFTDNSGKRASGYYLIVEALDKQNRAIEMPIPNQEEGGRTYRVKTWGEQVPKEVYDRVAADKRDDGIIQRDTLGRKETGYLEPAITMQGPGGRPFQRMGQITRW